MRTSVALALLFSTTHFLLSSATPDFTCPTWLQQSGTANDIGLLSEAVSWEGAETVQGTCGSYVKVYERHGMYDTRMRIYRSTAIGNHFFVFRPTQQNPTGGAIHDQRRMVQCTFLPDCKGQVHERFQQAWFDLTSGVTDWTPYLQNEVYVFGHSLGGALQLFMGLYLEKVHGKVPAMSLGLAGPFIGNEEFALAQQCAYRDASKGTWFQTETVNKYNSGDFDGTVEGYQVDPYQLYIERDVVCGFPISPLPIPSQSYGMHDLNQYRLFLTGTDCSF